MGLFNSVLPFSLMLWGQRQITAGLASILIATTPLFGVVVAHFATADDRITRAKAVGLTLGFAGVTLMLGPDLLSELGHDVLAQGALLAAAIAYALSGVFARRFRSLPVTSAAAGQMIAATIMLLPLALLDRPWTLAAPSPAAWAAIAGLGALSTALAYLLFFKVLARAGATNIMLVNFLIPVTGILLGVSILGERLEPRQLAGMAIIGLGLAAIDGRAARWAFQRRAALN
jgi:drug/metabolite transporter (DMT)-like permease